MNQLGNETSPYLLQHADNPVDWHPWNAAALDQARRENRPILLSIGYSACHWCHVMAHESFEDPATAAVMNQLFVNIKVDREERPDLDRIYQTAHHLMTQRAGGWPLTMFLTPDGQLPFFAGTYFPGTARYGMPAFSEVLERVAAYYHANTAESRDHGEQVRAALAQLEPAQPVAAGVLDAAPLADFRQLIARQFDREYGGFGGAPKFPHPATIQRLLQHWRGTAHAEKPDTEALFMAALTLSRMAEGGIYDHLGGGFCRYSVDRHWAIPHFEKMLYDNGPLLALYAQMFQISGDETYRTVARDTAEWALRDMRTAEGAFCSSLDADSEGQEGKFYVWTPEEIRTLVDTEEYAVLEARFGLDQPANFQEPAHDISAWHLCGHQSMEQIAAATGQPVSAVRRLLLTGRAKLHRARSQRVAPGRDDKILTSWNALIIRGLAISARVLNSSSLADAAAGSLDFIRAQLTVDGRLLATNRSGQSRLNAYLDDHAYLLDAVLELLQTRFSTAHLDYAIWLADCLLAHFEDRDTGGFWFTSHDHEPLLHRPKPMADDAMPSGNGIAAFALARLGWLLGELRYLDAAERTLRACWQGMQDFPHGHCSLLEALDEYLQPPEIIIIRGADEEAAQWAGTVAAAYNPHRMIFNIPNDAVGLPEALSAKSGNGRTTAYVCRGMSCGPMVTDLKTLLD
ncbi:MAG: thioredoxin domain-containing protein [Chromatiales bacterium]|nr:thioredoxin domain-containing protein [Chromatiales bacterium]